jgi:Zn-dependent peptidase ImmA (M78 family)
MDLSRSTEWALAFDAADRMYRERIDGAEVSEEQFDFLETIGPDPITLASLARITIGNMDNPIDSMVAVAKRLDLNVGVVPPKAQSKVTVFGSWFHDFPVLLIGEGKTKTSFNHAVAAEIGGLLLCRAAYPDGMKTREFKSHMRDFADAFLYPDSAVRELKYMPSLRRFHDHANDFSVNSVTIFRRLRNIGKN